MKIKIFSCLIALLLLLCSCGTDSVSTEVEGESSFFVSPDKIIIGANGEEKELLPGDKAFEDVLTGINARAESVEKFGAMLLAAYNYDIGKHLSAELREVEVFVEFIYNDVNMQSFMMVQSGGGSALEDKEVSRMFFALTGEYHKEFFVAKDADYKQSTTLGSLHDNTSLITYIRDLISTETAVE